MRAKTRKKKFDPIRVLNGRTFRKNKGRNIVAVLAILMTTIMFTTLFTLAQSMNENLLKMTFRQAGYDAQVSYKKISPEQAEKLKNHPDVKELGESIVLGVAENEKLSGRQVEIRWASNSYAEHSFGMPDTGRMPESSEELALDTIVLDRLGIPHELGQKVTLEFRKDVFDENEVPVQATFTLCGFWEGNESSYASMAWVSRDYVEQILKEAGVTVGDEAGNGVLGLYMVQINLHSDNNIEGTMDEIQADSGLESLEYGVNLAYSPEMGVTALEQTLPMYLGMMLVFIAGYLIIYNIFQISVTADVQFYGKLKTLGTTTKQIKKLIYGQANRLCVIGIPVGLLLGWILGMVLVPVFTGILEGESNVSVNPLIFIGSAAFAWLTVIISCLRPARLAGKVSPIEALRMSDADGKSKKKTKRSKSGASIAGMAWANLGRNKKRTVTVICSLTLGLVLLSGFYAKNASFDMEKYLEGLTICDFQLNDATSDDHINGYDPYGTTLNEELISKMENQEGVEATGHQYTKSFVWEMNDDTKENLENFYTEEMLDDWASYDAGGVEEFYTAMETGEMYAVVFGLDGIPLDTITQKQYILQGIFDAHTFAEGESVLVIGPAVEAEEKLPVLPTPSVGSTVTIEGKEYNVMAVVYPVSSVEEGASETGADDAMEMKFIVPADTFRTNWPENTMRKLFVNVDDAHVEEVQTWLDEYTKTEDSGLPVESRKTIAEQYERETGSSAVMGNAISVIIALVGVLNFINSMVTAIVSRKREFAMIQSVGMTKNQLCKMLVYEGLYYAGITLAVSYIISSFAVGIVIRAMTAGGFATFRFTLLPLVVCTPVLLVLAALIPFLCFKNLEKQSIVERLRME